MPGVTKTTFKKGEGRKPGSQNKLTRTVKDVVLATFNSLQNDKAHNLEAFAKKNPRDFYQIAAKLIPTEIKGNVKQTNKVLLEIVRNTKDTTEA
jgi:hypothetical protein